MGGRRLIYDSALRELFRLRSLEGPLTRPIRASLVLLAAAPSCLFARIPQTSSSIAIEAVLVNPKENRDWPAGAKMAFRWTAVSRAQMASLLAGQAESGNASRPSDTTRQPPSPPPSHGAVRSPAIKDDAIDEAYLKHLDDELGRNPTLDNRRRLVRAYEAAASFLKERGDPEGAIERYRHALDLAVDDADLPAALGSLLIEQNREDEALDLLLPAADRHPENPDIPALLGSAFYAMEDLGQATEEWSKALAVQDSPRVREALEKAEREQKAASFYRELRSDHFLLRSNEDDVRALANEVLATLENAYLDLQSDLGFSPRDRIIVLLYPRQAFRDVTRSPSWAGGVNDGKIRVPVSGLSSLTPELARVLKHELTHSFIRQATLGRCPQWFNEGLAQLEEGASTAALRPELRRAAAETSIPALSALEGSFLTLPADQAASAYAKSLAALEYLRDAHGMAAIRQLLKLLASGQAFASLLEQECEITYATLEQEAVKHLKR